MQTDQPQGTWLHLSDFHFEKDDRYDRKAILRALIQAIERFAQQGIRPDAILVTGDIGTRGVAEDYAPATSFFNALLAASKLGRENLAVIPGNHDVERPRGAFLKRTLDSDHESSTYFSPCVTKPHFEKQTAFREWYNNFFSGIKEFPSASTCGPVECIPLGSWRLGIIPINSALFSQDDQDVGRLWVGRRCIDDAISKLSELRPDVSVALIHHPLDWLHEEEGTNITARLRSSMDCILRGHLHKNDVEDVTGTSGRCLHLAAGAAYQTNQAPNRALYVTLRADQFSVFPIRYEDAAEAWTVDPSVYPLSVDHRGSYNFSNIVRSSVRVEIPDIGSLSATLTPKPAPPPAAVPSERQRPEYEDDLFETPSGARMYAEPRLMTRPQAFSFQGEAAPDQLSVSDLVDSEDSYLIQTKPEYGGTTLCKRLDYEFHNRGIQAVFRRDARSLPNYRKKLEASIPKEGQVEGSSILILDHFDAERDERLLRELAATKWFRRVIAVTVDRSLFPIKTIDVTSLPFRPKEVFLWNIARSDVRQIAETLFQTADGPFISAVVDKVYNDLLALCIPLTPSNVVMYLRILHKEGEFHPLNRVHILSRYLQEILRRPSDVYRDTFNSKNKMDVLGAFVYKMYQEDRSDFDQRYWYDFMEAYQRETLTEFNPSEFLNELIESRVVGKFHTLLYFKYSFFYNFFLGRHIATRKSILDEFLEKREYLRLNGIVDVITGVSPDNASLVLSLTETLEAYLTEFGERFISSSADPLLKAVWPDHPEEDKLWETVSSQIEASPRSANEIDSLKSSLIAEARTADQQVQLEKFVQLESALFAAAAVLRDALQNSDDIPGELKLRALEATYRCNLVTFQIGTAFAPILSQRHYFQWGGIGFLEFNKVIRDAEPGSPEASFAVVDALSTSVACHAAEKMGSKKLGPVFRTREKGIVGTSFVDLVNFFCMLASKPQGWEELLAKSIERTDKNAYYLAGMLDGLLISLENDLLPGRDREKIKRLVALIRAKRHYGKQAPGSKAVGKVLAHLEKKGEFDKDKRE